MEFSVLIKGMIMGFSIAAPVGPIGILCIRRTLSRGMMSGFVSGLGTATADALYGSAAAFGITAVSGFLLDNRLFLHLAGGLFLLYLGFRSFMSVPAGEAANAAGEGLAGSYISAFLLTLTNPMTILSFAAVFAGLMAGRPEESYIPAVLLVLGVFTGSALWWLALSGAVSLLRGKFDRDRLKWVNRLSGIVIAGFGVISLYTLAAH